MERGGMACIRGRLAAEITARGGWDCARRARLAAGRVAEVADDAVEVLQPDTVLENRVSVLTLVDPERPGRGCKEHDHRFRRGRTDQRDERASGVARRVGVDN